MRSKAFFSSLCMLLCVALLGACQSKPAANAVDELAVTAPLKAWMNVLAADSLEGRGTGTVGIEKAALYLEQEYKKLGLQMVPGTNSYRQYFTTNNNLEAFNVVGYLPGTDPALANECIVLSAHYDHIGIGKPVNGDSINNGADDDASGVITMMGVVHELKQANIKLKRPLLLLAVSAEEIGLQGSKYYVKEPLIPLNETLVNLNFEMTAHADSLGEKRFFMTGANYSTLAQVVAPIARQNGWEMVDDPFPNFNLFFRSDNASFARAVTLGQVNGQDQYRGVPAHTFCTWGGETHYHTPTDEADIVNYENMQGLVKVMTQLVQHIGNEPTNIKWTNERFKAFE